MRRLLIALVLVAVGLLLLALGHQIALLSDGDGWYSVPGAKQ